MSHDLRLERRIEATPEVVFDAFTDPDAQKELYADGPDWIVESECDLRVGGRWTISFGPPDGTPAVESNLFQVVDRPRRLAFSSTMKLPDGSSLDTELEVTFEARENGTTTVMTIVQRGFPTAETRDDFTRGWSSILDGLERVVAARATRALALPQGHLGLLRNEAAERLLASTVPARLAYVATDGTPRIVPSWHWWTGEELVMPTFVAAPHVRHPAAPLAARRFLGEEEGAAYIAQIDQPGLRMARIAVRPTWVGIIDFQTRLPSPLGGVTG